jgi:outer membrane protein OmpA-like peptidoglycan-associated protein
MLSPRALLLATTTLSLLAFPALAETRPATAAQKPIVLAQSDETSDPAVLAAEEAVDKARADLRDAMANGGDVKAARRTLNEALKSLNEARVAAGLPPLGKSGEKAETPTAEPPQAAEPPAATGEAPPDEQKPPRLGKKPPRDNPPETAGQPPQEEQPKEAPPEKAEQPPEKPIPPKAEGQPPEKPVPPKAEGQPPEKPVPPKAEGQPPEKPGNVVGSPPQDGGAGQTADQPEVTNKPPRLGKKPPRLNEPPVEAQQPPADDQPEGKPRFTNKPPLYGKKPPRFDDRPRDAEAPPPPLPKSAGDIKEGQEIKAEDGRTIIREGGQITIRHDDDSRFEREGNVKVTPVPGGGTKTVVSRPNGVKIVTLRDRDGNILERYRQLPNGKIIMLIGDVEAPPPPPPGAKGPKDRRPPPMAGGGDYDFDRYLPPVRVQIPRNDYIVESQRASRRQIEEALVAPPVERVERRYSLDEIRRSARLRAKLRRIDIDTITFEFGQATVPEDQVDKLEVIGRALQRVIQRDPNEVFLIEGHTDAVGSDLANLALSDRRAESVAEILSYYFDIPPENLITQGYGEQYLKIPTLAPERENRRVTMRRITPLLSAGQ